MNLTRWAIRHGVSYEALEDLRRELGASDPVPGTPAPGDTSEAASQARIRLEASRLGLRLWRNNVGAFKTEQGSLVRYGLANDSAAVNKHVKSGDLIGIRPVMIRPYHVGMVLGQFVSREVKAPGWRYSGTEREQAQLRWAQLVASMGGDACFTTGEGTL